MSYFLRHPADNFPNWPPLFIQRPYTLVGIQVRNKLEDLAVNIDPQLDNGKQIPISGIPRPATFGSAQTKSDGPLNHEYRGTYGPSLYDYFWQTQGYQPNPNQVPGTNGK